MQTAAFVDYLEREKQDILDHCTQCGICVEVCPMPQYAPAIAQADPVLVVGKVLELLRTGVISPEAQNLGAEFAPTAGGVSRPVQKG